MTCSSVSRSFTRSRSASTRPPRAATRASSAFGASSTRAARYRRRCGCIRAPRRWSIVCTAARGRDFLGIEVRRQLAIFESRVKLTYLTDVSLDELRSRVATLDRRAIVLFVVFYDPRGADRPGRYSRDVAAEVARVSGRPVYGLFSSYLHEGVIGGHVYSLRGRQRLGCARGAADPRRRATARHPGRRRARRADVRLAGAAALAHRRVPPSGRQPRALSRGERLAGLRRISARGRRRLLRAARAHRRAPRRTAPAAARAARRRELARRAGTAHRRT